MYSKLQYATYFHYNKLLNIMEIKVEFLGHVKRMEEDHADQMDANRSDLLSTARAMCPERRRDLGTGNWQKQAQNLGMWWNLVSEAQTHFGSLRYQIGVRGI